MRPARPRGHLAAPLGRGVPRWGPRPKAGATWRPRRAGGQTDAGLDPIALVAADGALLESPYDDVVEETAGVEARTARHSGEFPAT